METSPKILIFGEQGIKSSPSLTLAQLLRQAGYYVKLRSSPKSTPAWLNEVRQYDCVIYIGYGKVSDWLIRQVSVVVGLFNIPFIRWWVGSDVFYLLHDNSIAQQARLLDKFISINVAVAPHLVTELISIGIHANVIPIIPTQYPHYDTLWSNETAHQVLVYLPTERDNFYGAKLLDEVIPQNPDFTFTLLRNDGKRYRNYKNALALNWTDDMESIYRNTGCLIRCTKHDGLPRMLLEALALGKYAIYSWPLEGCLLARTPEEVNVALREVVGCTQPNLLGANHVIKNYSHDNFNSGFEQLYTQSRHFNFKRKLRAIVFTILSLKKKLIIRFCNTNDTT